MSVFVGTCTVESDDELRLLIKKLPLENPYSFLRWPHKISGFCPFTIDNFPNEFPSPEGQLFDREIELRWKQNKKGYDLLLLSTNNRNLWPDFEPIFEQDKDNTIKWEAYDQDAYIYPPTETRFSKRIAEQSVNIGQRYFVDAQTATVHFVALRVSENHDCQSS
ncbi:MAG: hypothetical protein AAGB13_01725 [Cyanobacteria bacterium P01_F01_bin.33]